MALKQSYGGHHTKFLFRSLVQAKTRTLRKDKDIRHDTSKMFIHGKYDGFEENSSNIVKDEEFELFYDANKSENLKFLIGTTNDLI